MSGSGRGERTWQELHAYHDGELSGLARWRFERRLRRSEGLRRELAELARLGALVRAAEAPAPGPDLWDRIEQRLPAVDAQRAEESGGRRASLGWWMAPAGAMAATALAALAVWWGPADAPVERAGVVRWMDSGGRSVMVLEGDADTTIIWVLDGPADGAIRGEGREMA
jgi:anti-sigma-K factor RskA